MANIKAREEVQSLRIKGKSIRDISKELNISKSTVSYWCRDIVLTKDQIDNLQEKQSRAGVRALLKINEEKRRRRLDNEILYKHIGEKDVGRLSKRDLLILGLGLYWGEGYKKGNQELGFTNSDPEIIDLFIKWINEIYGVTKDKLILRVSINSTHKDRLHRVQKYWSIRTNISLSQFTKPSLIKVKSKKIYSNHDEHFGTLRVKVRNGTNLRRRILGSIGALSQF